MSTFLVRFLEQYFEVFLKHFNSKLLNINLLKGLIELNQIQLNEKVFDYLLQLPETIGFKQITCQKLLVKVPWRSLKTEPVSVELQGLRFIAAELDEARVIKPMPKVDELLFGDPNAKSKFDRYASEIMENIAVEIRNVSFYLQMKCGSGSTPSENPSDVLSKNATERTVLIECDEIALFSVNELMNVVDLATIRKENKTKPYHSVFKKLLVDSFRFSFVSNPDYVKIQKIRKDSMKEKTDSTEKPNKETFSQIMTPPDSAFEEKQLFCFLEPWSGAVSLRMDWKTQRLQFVQISLNSLSLTVPFSTRTFDAFVSFCTRIADCGYVSYGLQSMRSTNVQSQSTASSSEEAKKEASTTTANESIDPSDMAVISEALDFDEELQTKIEDDLFEMENEIAESFEIINSDSKRNIIEFSFHVNIVRFVASIEDITFELTKLYLFSSSCNEYDYVNNIMNITCLSASIIFKIGNVLLSAPISSADPKAKPRSRRLISHKKTQGNLFELKFYHDVNQSKINGENDSKPSEIEIQMSSLRFSLCEESILKLFTVLNGSFLETFVNQNISEENFSNLQKSTKKLAFDASFARNSNHFFREWMRKCKYSVKITDLFLRYSTRHEKIIFQIQSFQLGLGRNDLLVNARSDSQLKSIDKETEKKYSNFPKFEFPANFFENNKMFFEKFESVDSKWVNIPEKGEANEEYNEEKDEKDEKMKEKDDSYSIRGFFQMSNVTLLISFRKKQKFEIIERFSLNIFFEITDWIQILNLLLRYQKTLTKRPTVSLIINSSPFICLVSQVSGVSRIWVSALRVKNEITKMFSESKSRLAEKRKHESAIVKTDRSEIFLHYYNYYYNTIQSATDVSSFSISFFGRKQQKRKRFSLPWKSVMEVFGIFRYRAQIVLEGVHFCVDAPETRIGMLLDSIATAMDNNEVVDIRTIINQTLIFLTVSDEPNEEEELSSFFNKKTSGFFTDLRGSNSSDSTNNSPNSFTNIENDNKIENESELVEEAKGKVFDAENSHRNDLFRFHFITHQNESFILFSGFPNRFLMSSHSFRNEIILITPIKDQYNMYLHSLEDNQKNIENEELSLRFDQSLANSNRISINAFGFTENNEFGGKVSVDVRSFHLQIFGVPTKRLSQTIQFIQDSFTPKRVSEPEATPSESEHNRAHQIKSFFRYSRSKNFPFTLALTLADSMMEYGTVLAPPRPIQQPGKEYAINILSVPKPKHRQEPEVKVFLRNSTDNNENRLLKESFLVQINQLRKRYEQDKLAQENIISLMTKTNEENEALLLEYSVKLAHLQEQNETSNERYEILRIRYDQLTALCKTMKFAKSGTTLADIQPVLENFSVSAVREAKERERMETELKNMEIVKKAAFDELVNVTEKNKATLNELELVKQELEHAKSSLSLNKSEVQNLQKIELFQNEKIKDLNERIETLKKQNEEQEVKLSNQDKKMKQQEQEIESLKEQTKEMKTPKNAKAESTHSGISAKTQLRKRKKSDGIDILKGFFDVEPTKQKTPKQKKAPESEKESKKKETQQTQPTGSNNEKRNNNNYNDMVWLRQ